MKKNCFIILLYLFFLNSALPQAPTYNLTAKNFSVGTINQTNDALFFDVYIEWTNSGVAPNFEFAGSQLYFSFNRNILSIPPGVWPPTGGAANPDTTHFSYKIVGSDLVTAMQPRHNSLYTASSPTADIMRGAINTFPGAGFGTNIPAGFPGVKIARYRLWNKTGCFRFGQLNIAWRNPPVVAFTTKIFAYVGTTNTDITTSGTHTIEFSNDPFGCTLPSPISLNLKFIPEGLYSSMFNLLYRKDTVKIYLRDASPPYSFIDSAINRIDSISFLANYSFQNALTGTYYIVSKHFNSLETWSKSGGQYMKIDSTVNYDFTFSASQAYGNNLKLRGTKYCAFTGDITQDGFIDGDDIRRIDNDSYLYLSGSNLSSDLNGDGIVDGIDFLIGDNNWQYITVKSPLNISDSGFKHRAKKYYEP